MDTIEQVVSNLLILLSSMSRLSGVLHSNFAPSAPTLTYSCLRVETARWLAPCLRSNWLKALWTRWVCVV